MDGTINNSAVPDQPISTANTSSQLHSDQLKYWLGLNRVNGFGPKKYRALLEYFDNPVQIFNASQAELKHVGFSQKALEKLKNPDWEGVDKDLGWLDSHPEHHIVTLSDSRYPVLLKELPDPPLLLYINGDPDLLALPQLAIVGSRSASQLGLEIAHEFAHVLAGAGMVITSGLALGIDAAAHQGALRADGKTVAVLGTGPDRIYPARHLDLAHEIVASGVIVSEFIPGMTPRKENFPRRNRLISGLCMGTLVVEAAQRSGSLITARLALEQGREVFAVPGSIRNPQVKGCHALIRDGAKLVESVEDIIEDLRPFLQSLQNDCLAAKAKIRTAEQVVSDRQNNDGQSDKNSGKLLEALGYDPVPIDVLVERTGLTASELSSMLLSLELEGQVCSQAGGMYVRIR